MAAPLAGLAGPAAWTPAAALGSERREEPHGCVICRAGNASDVVFAPSRACLAGSGQVEFMPAW